jgi:hypothetical protein
MFFMEANDRRGVVRPRRMMLVVSLLAAGLSILPATASADGKPQPPRYPPGFDCSATPAGSQRQACNRSQFNPPMGAIPETKGTPPNGLVFPQPQPPELPAGKPPTIPRLPGTIDNGN